ncbi:hypothetical protein [Methanoregula sp.]|uniref:hypothetical protein n=1 Tax=Methanoregula sp. TaxID=2052170 RepID=UPI003C773B0D
MDIIDPLVQERKNQDFVAHLDTIAKEGEFVPLDSDAEYVILKKEMHRESDRSRQ